MVVDTYKTFANKYIEYGETTNIDKFRAPSVYCKLFFILHKALMFDKNAFSFKTAKIFWLIF